MNWHRNICPKGGCGVVSFELEGGRAAAEKFMKHLKLAAIETHVADAKNLLSESGDIYTPPDDR